MNQKLDTNILLIILTKIIILIRAILNTQPELLERPC